MEQKLNFLNKINEFDKNGLTVLHKAVINNNIELTKSIIKKGADINLRAEYNYTPIQLACLYNHLEIATILLKNGCNLINEELLYFSCSNKNKKMTELLIKYNCNVNEVDSYGRTPAFWAVQEKSIECLNALTENGANLCILSEKEGNLLSYAVGEGNIEIVKYLLENGLKEFVNNKEYPPINIAAHWNYIEILDILIKNGADINMMDLLGNTALIDSIKNGNYETVLFLLKNNANIDMKFKEIYEKQNEKLREIGKYLQ